MHQITGISSWKQARLNIIFFIRMPSNWRRIMYLTIQAIVLRVTDYNDRDALLTVLSRNHGKLSIKARAAEKQPFGCTLSASGIW